MADDERWAQVMAHMPAVGDSFRLNYGEGRRANKLIHIRAIVDGEYIVYRYWRNFRWIYEMTDVTFFFVTDEAGVATKVTRND